MKRPMAVYGRFSVACGGNRAPCWWDTECQSMSIFPDTLDFAVVFPPSFNENVHSRYKRWLQNGPQIVSGEVKVDVDWKAIIWLPVSNNRRSHPCARRPHLYTNHIPISLLPRPIIHRKLFHNAWRLTGGYLRVVLVTLVLLMQSKMVTPHRSFLSSYAADSITSLWRSANQSRMKTGNGQYGSPLSIPLLCTVAAFQETEHRWSQCGDVYNIGHATCARTWRDRFRNLLAWLR